MVGEVERGWEDWPRCLSGSADVCGMPQRNHCKGRLLWGHGSAKCGFGFEGGAFSSRVIVLALALWWGFLAIGAKSRRDALVVRFAFGCEWCSRCMGFQAWRRVHGVGRESTRTEHVWGNPVSHFCRSNFGRAAGFGVQLPVVGGVAHVFAWCLGVAGLNWNILLVELRAAHVVGAYDLSAAGVWGWRRRLLLVVWRVAGCGSLGLRSHRPERPEL